MGSKTSLLLLNKINVLALIYRRKKRVKQQRKRKKERKKGFLLSSSHAFFGIIWSGYDLKLVFYIHEYSRISFMNISTSQSFLLDLIVSKSCLAYFH